MKMALSNLQRKIVYVSKFGGAGMALILSRLPRSSSSLLLTLCCLTAIPIGLLVLIPMSASGQILFGTIGVVLACILRPASKFLIPRLLLLCTASVVGSRYWIWRITETMPDPSISLAFGLSCLLLLAETFTLIAFFLNCFVSTDPTSIKVPRHVPKNELPSVDVLVPTFNETTDLLSVTLLAAKAMDYPAEKRSIILCDDGGTDERCNSLDFETAISARQRRQELQALCLELEILYTTRARNENAKAGNLQAALQRTTGELLAVFDADHVPSRDFLTHTVGFMVDDPKLFLVQTPHFFTNSDPVHRNLGLRAHCPAESEMFYSDVLRGLDRWGGAFFCGSAALLRREALDSVGGFSGQTITEDAETALTIHCKGWKSLYIDRTMVAGLQPETFASFIQQRGRWASGMIQLMILKNALFRRGLTLPQRLCYLNSIFSWFFPFVRLVYLITPLLYLFFGVRFFLATRSDAFANISAYIAMAYAVQSALFARSRWLIISEIYETAQAPYLVVAILRTLFSPRGAKFNVTSKDEKLNADFVSPLHFPLTMLLTSMVAGCAALFARWIAFPEDHSALSVIGGFAIFNLLLVSLAYRAVFEKQRRKAPVNFGMSVKATLTRSDRPEAIWPVTIVEASLERATLAYSQSTSTSEVITAWSQQGSEVILRAKFADAPRWKTPLHARLVPINPTSSDGSVALIFADGQRSRIRETLAMIYGDGDRWRAIRGSTLHPRSMVHGLVYALALLATAIPLLFIDIWKCVIVPTLNLPLSDNAARYYESANSALSSIDRGTVSDPAAKVSSELVS